MRRCFSPISKPGPRNRRIVKYQEYVRLATQYRQESAAFFKTKKERNKTQWGNADFRIIPKNTTEFPDTILKISDGYLSSRDGYVNEFEQPKEIFILADKQFFIEEFESSFDELTETIKHEIRHWIQLNQIVGLPKEKVLHQDPNTDIAGHRYNSMGDFVRRIPHHNRDIEFKPNLYTYAFYIKRWINKNAAKPDWKQTFIKLVSGKLPHIYDDMIQLISRNLKELMNFDKVRWKQFVKELYLLVIDR